MRLRPRGFTGPQRKTCLKERVWDFLPKVTQASGVIEIWCQVKSYCIFGRGSSPCNLFPRRGTDAQSSIACDRNQSILTLRKANNLTGHLTFDIVRGTGINYPLLCVNTAERGGKVIQKELKKSLLALKSLPTQHCQQSRESRAASVASLLEKQTTDLNSGVLFERWVLANECCSANGIPL